MLCLPPKGMTSPYSMRAIGQRSLAASQREATRCLTLPHNPKSHQKNVASLCYRWTAEQQLQRRCITTRGYTPLCPPSPTHPIVQSITNPIIKCVHIIKVLPNVKLKTLGKLHYFIHFFLQRRTMEQKYLIAHHVKGAYHERLFRSDEINRTSTSTNHRVARG